MPVVFFVDPDIVGRAGTEEHHDHHAVLHLLPDRRGEAGGRRASGRRGRNRKPTPTKISGADMADATRKTATRLPPRRPEPVAVRRLGRRADHGHRRRRLDAVPEGRRVPPVRPEHRRRRGCSSSASRSCSTPCSPGGRTRSRKRHEGDHTRVVSLHLRYGMIMFIASEVMFFVAWFWAFFDASLFADEAIQVCARRLHRRRLAAEGHRGSRSLPPAAAQHHHPAAVGHHGHLGAPRAAAQRPQGPDLGPGAHRRARRAVLHRAGLRVRPRAVRLRRHRSMARPSSWRPASTASTC